MKLLSFDTRVVLPFKVADKAQTGRELFDAFWILFKMTDNPAAELVRTSIKVVDYIEKKTVPGGSIRQNLCFGCGMRRANYDDLRTLPADCIVLDLKFEDKQFDYIKGCLDKWSAVPPELKKYLGVLQDIFEGLKSQDDAEIEKFIAERDTPKSE